MPRAGAVRNFNADLHAVTNSVGTIVALQHIDGAIVGVEVEAQFVEAVAVERDFVGTVKHT
ncbi:MAG: hypothetical protein RLZZ519_535 [Bacteroidota bacterium]|jgi:hypothetical protein